MIPNIIYKVFHYKIVNNQNVQDNELKHFDIPNDQSRDVVMPNPDFLYSTSFYDLSNGDLNLKGKMPESTYWSVSFYKPNTVNWFVKNDDEFIDNNLDMKIIYLILTKKIVYFTHNKKRIYDYTNSSRKER